ncbi:divalent metal cation transporter [Heyndrickxia sporothermodurans]|uniref:Divalent metal cation transporter MntH n=1 Tax=Heyndrickxia sporothermodurans TaxID=46224 RepID=A0AB37HJI2_9BACI|nr:Nramp family divalent metal transporter [Heyndrickxia sporothermodurans]MBL5766899.1 Nramp family divalent metal transporter [Heyndrickxia sporothermodurans]MBL5771545.1 Nramp family divalent metal transporter [Heyndrickxia sporothermodurans]MBL5773893.1 Nramp family divalent metal transporter [Heyndrickxia sporothermodurans]MBL5778276.1 Nramp family divalent metal transporter [Heyndrickxia sporothermodurans]MBL5780892.1 Nramp family divalent metal transporter [Heyndrickxia sporothermoduran
MRDKTLDKKYIPKISKTRVSADAVLRGEVTGIKKILPFLGPAFIAAVAYIDPGNFATNITAGSKYGYLLLWVIAFSNLMAVLIQSLSAKLGIATGKNLPEVARDRFPKGVSIFLWIQSELVIIATDLAEFIGAALGLYLLFDIPMIPAALITAVGSFAILELQRRGFRSLEAGIAAMVLIVVLAFAFQTFLAKPDMGAVLGGMVTPKFEGVDSILLAAGILGATVMPHAIYLHSSLTQNRIVGKNEAEKKRIFKFEFIDIIIAMIIAGAINMCMLIVSAALFFKNGLVVEDLDVAFHQFGQYVSPIAAISFGLGLLIAGLSSSSVGTMSGDVVMQGFINVRINLYLRRAITMIPALAIIISGVNPTNALVMSQVVLSFGIAFALVPLIMFTSNKKLMGGLTNHRVTTIISWIVAALVILLNIFLLIETVF